MLFSLPFLVFRSTTVIVTSFILTPEVPCRPLRAFIHTQSLSLKIHRFLCDLHARRRFVSFYWKRLMFCPKGPSNYPQPIITLYAFMTTFPLFAVPSVPQSKPPLGPWSSCSQWCRRLLVSISRLRIGHTRLTHDHLMAREALPVCGRCHVRLSIFHILVECPTYSVPRNRGFSLP